MPLCIMHARAIGVMRTRDDKIIAVNMNDPVYSERRNLEGLPDHKLREIPRFFEDYKAPEHKDVVVEGMQERAEAIEILRDSLAMYRKLRRGERPKRQPLDGLGHITDLRCSKPLIRWRTHITEQSFTGGAHA